MSLVCIPKITMLARFALLAAALAGTALAQEDFICPDEFEGYYPHDTSCDKYWECKEGIATLELCGNGLAFDDLDPTYTTKNCDYMFNVECGNRTEFEPPISAPNCPRLYGTFADPDDCTGFYNCREGLANRFSCAPGLAFDPQTRVCKWADQVKACKTQTEEEEEEVFSCPKDIPRGIFSKHAHPADCRQYFVCISGTPREYGCPLGTVFKIGNDALDGKCADPEEVPECANYYGDLEFDKQELVKAGVDPEAVGAKVISRPNRVHRPVSRGPVIPKEPKLPEPIEDEEDDFILPEPVRPTVTRTRPNRIRPRPSIPETPAPVRVAPPVPTRTRTRPVVHLPEPVNRRPATTVAPTTAAPVIVEEETEAPAPVEVPAIPLATLVTEAAPVLVPVTASPAVPAAPASPAAPAGLGQPDKVKAGEDYYYYYYYYDDEYPEEGAEAGSA